MTVYSDAYDGERAARLILTRLQTNLPARLAVVAARWATEAPVTLPHPVTYQLGFNPTLLEHESVAFPIVATIPAERTPGPEATLWGIQDETQVVDIHYFVVAEDAATVALRAWRYAEAIAGVMQAARGIAEFHQLNFKPEVEIGIAGRHPKTRLADLMAETDVDYVQGGRVTVVLSRA